MLEFQGTVKELRQQLLALQESDVRDGRYRLAAGILSVASLAGAHFWRVLQWPALVPARCVFAITLLGCTIVLVRLWTADVNDAKLGQISKLLSLLRASVAGHGPLTLKAALGDSGAAWDNHPQGRFSRLTVADHSARVQNWLSITAPLDGAQVYLCAQRATYTGTRQDDHGSAGGATEVDGLAILFTSDQPDRVARLKSAIDTAPHHEMRANVLEDGALCTTLREAPQPLVPTPTQEGRGIDTAATALSCWVEWYLDRLASSH
jgi:hypothetical protein